jgi:hypothetical protein
MRLDELAPCLVSSGRAYQRGRVLALMLRHPSGLLSQRGLVVSRPSCVGAPMVKSGHGRSNALSP